VLRPNGKDISKQASQWANSIKKGDTMFVPDYTERLERLRLLTLKSRQRPSLAPTIVFKPAKLASPKSF
jgi:hypothetical protein